MRKREDTKKSSLRKTRWKKANPEKAVLLRRRMQLRLYGLTPEQYDELLIVQGGVCASCGCGPKGTGRQVYLVVDHDHKTGINRGLLCSQCNVALGLLYEDPVRIFALLGYLLGSDRLLR